MNPVEDIEFLKNRDHKVQIPAIRNLAKALEMAVDEAVGRFLTTADNVSQISSPVSASIALNRPANATAETLNAFVIPARTTIFTGGVAGGADTAVQSFIRDSSVLIPKL